MAKEHFQHYNMYGNFSRENIFANSRIDRAKRVGPGDAINFIQKALVQMNRLHRSAVVRHT